LITLESITVMAHIAKMNNRARLLVSMNNK
jgi:hypothetical protein